MTNAEDGGIADYSLEESLENDIAMELALDAISETTPEIIDSEAAAFAVEKDTTLLTGVFLSEETIPEPFADKGIISNMDTVEAILAVAQQAAEAAEASLPKDVADSIPLIPTRNLNDSMVVPDILPAVKVVGQPVTSERFDYPSVKRVIIFAASATGVFLCSPLLSLIDTSAVGLLSGTVQQAALNPAVAVTDYAALLIVS